jgi:hypothetical protein
MRVPMNVFLVGGLVWELRGQSLKDPAADLVSLAWASSKRASCAGAHVDAGVFRCPNEIGGEHAVKAGHQKFGGRRRDPGAVGRAAHARRSRHGRPAARPGP